MNAMEIVLLIAGALIFILSFVLPEGREKESVENKALAKEGIKELVAEEMSSIKGHVDDVVEEAVGYAMEKTERSLERLSNEKIMAVNQYSDTVLQEINKNHQEVMFLYDMLNDKHANLKNTVSEVDKTVKKAEETKKEAQEVMHTFRKLTPEKKGEVNRESQADNMSKSDAEQLKEKSEKQPEKAGQQTSRKSGLPQEAADNSHNCNAQILKLYKEGKSKMAIAKELGLGVGEVKLVIDLYKNM